MDEPKSLHEYDTSDIEKIFKMTFKIIASSDLESYLTETKKTKSLEKEIEKTMKATTYAQAVKNLENNITSDIEGVTLYRLKYLTDSDTSVLNITLYSLYKYMRDNPSKKLDVSLTRYETTDKISGLKFTVKVPSAIDTSIPEAAAAPAAAPKKPEVKEVRLEKDPDYFYTPSEKEILEVAINRGKNVYIAGPTGVGKTELATRVCNALGKSYYRVNFDGEFSKSDFTGDWVLSKDPEDRTTTVMIFNDGVLPTAMKEGAVLILDEFDAAPPEILFTLQSVLEGKPLMNTKKTETVMPAKGFCIIATANTVGKGDLTSFYAGTRLMNQATLDRFHYVIRMDYLPEKIETEILMRRTGCEEKLAKNVITFMNNARKAASDGSLFETFSLRKAINLCDAVEEDKLSLRLAFKATVLDRASEEDSIKVKELAQRIWTDVV